MGGITEYMTELAIVLNQSPSPYEVARVSYRPTFVTIDYPYTSFPYPREVIRGSNKLAHYVYETKTYLFPYPPEVNGVSY